MNNYIEEKLGAYTIGGLDWEFGRYLETGMYYIQCLDYVGVRHMIMADTQKEARDAAMDFIEKFLEQNR